MSFLTTRDNSPHARFQIFLVGAGDLGWDRALAHVEERPNQEIAASLETVLRISIDRIAAPDDGCIFALGKARDRTPCGQKTHPPIYKLGISKYASHSLGWPKS